MNQESRKIGIVPDTAALGKGRDARVRKSEREFLVADHRSQLLFAHDFHPEFFGFGEFAAGFFSGEEVAGFGTDASSDFSAGGANAVGENVAWLAQGSGDDPGGVREGGRGFRAALRGIGELGFKGKTKLAQLSHAVLIDRGVEKVADGTGDDGADVIDFLQLFDRGVGERFDAAKVGHEGLRGGGADVENPDAEEEAPRGPGFGGIDPGEQFFDALLAHALELEDVVKLQAVKVGNVAGETGVDQLIDHDGTKALDVHGAPAGIVAKLAAHLLRANGVGAEDFHFASLMRDGRIAGRAVVRHDEGDFVAGAFFGEDTNDRRDDFARFLDHDEIADANVFSLDLLLVVKGGAGDGGATDEDRFQVCDGGERAGSPDLDVDAVNLGFGLFGFEFEGDGPAWRLGGDAELALAGDGVDFDDRAVGLVGEFVTVMVDLADCGEGFLEIGGVPDFRRGGESAVAEKVVKLVLRFEGETLQLAKPVHDQVERAFGGDLGIKLLEGAGRGIARIGKRGIADVFPLLIQLGESGIGHEHLAPDFEERGGRRLRQGQRQTANGAHVVGDDVAGLAIAPRGRVFERAILVDDGNGNAIDLGLDHDGDVFGVELLLEALVEVDQFLFGIGVVQAHHADRMLDLGEAFQRCAADPLRRRIRRGEFGKPDLQITQLAELIVKLAVADLGLSFLVIEPVVSLQLQAEALNFLFC